MKRQTICAVGTLTVLAMLFTVSCKKKTEAHEVRAQAIDVAIPEIDSVVLFHTYPGVLKADRQADVVARVDGTLMSMHYSGGDWVTEGQLLFNIEDDNYRDAVQRARASVATAESELEYATQHYQALCRALETEAVSRMEVAQGESAMETAQAALNSARAQLNTSLTSLGYCSIRAPFSGHISSNRSSVGAYISGAAQPAVLATIYADQILTATFSIEDATFLDVLRSNIEENGIDYQHMPLHFVDTLSHRYTGRLNYMAPAIDPSTGTMVIEAKVDNSENELRTGMFVSIDLPVGFLERAILIKDSAISSDQRGKYVYTVNDSNQVVYTPVEVGQLVRDSLRVVNSGLDANSRYVTKALLRVRPGMTVDPHVTQ